MNIKPEQLKELKLKEIVLEEVLTCANCNRYSEFSILLNGDVVCSHCEDKKGNIK